MTNTKYSGQEIKAMIEKAVDNRLDVKMIADFDETHYIFSALVRGENKGGKVLPHMYAIDKRNGELSGFAQSADPDKFYDATTNRRLL